MASSVRYTTSDDRYSSDHTQKKKNKNKNYTELNSRTYIPIINRKGYFYGILGVKIIKLAVYGF